MGSRTYSDPLLLLTYATLCDVVFRTAVTKASCQELLQGTSGMCLPRSWDRDQGVERAFGRPLSSATSMI